MNTMAPTSGIYLLSLMKGVGPKTLHKLNSIGIYSLQDLLFYLPLRYEDRTRITSIADAKAGQQCLMHVTVSQTQIQYGRKRQLVCHVTDDSGKMQLRFFNFYKNQYNSLNKPGIQMMCFGQIREFKGIKQMLHPKLHYLNEGEAPQCDEYLSPIYKSAAGIPQSLWQKMMLQALNILPNMNVLVELIPQTILEQYKLVCLKTAIAWVHRPPKDVARHLLYHKTHPCWQRLAFEELLAQHIQMAHKRLEREQYQSHQLCDKTSLAQKLMQQLPFALTQDQRDTIEAIRHDCSNSQPMLRLVQGDVGCGKTLVAIMAMLHAAESGLQAALMVPTELLAEQHLLTLKKYLSPLGIAVASLLGKHTAKQRKPVLEQLSDGTLQIVVGTHALFQDGVVFKNMALIVIDEQHRFGVHQRMMFCQKGARDNKVAHQLIMTATPIPRTLAMTAYADMDTSTIKQMPAGRKKITTSVMDNSNRVKLMTHVKHLLSTGAQVYWLCTRIDAGDESISDASIQHEYLIKELSPYRVGLIHGRLTADEKTEVMAAFVNNQIQVLVATTVIEVGVDVPNAQLMIIENAERLGLAQLHQLRGRVGRSDQQSYCVLLYQPELSKTARQRLDTMRHAADGFAIAEKDLQLRGAGEILGTQQSGDVSYRFADLGRDVALCEAAFAAAQQMLKHPPEQQQALIERWSPVSCDYQTV